MFAEGLIGIDSPLKHDKGTHDKGTDGALVETSPGLWQLGSPLSALAAGIVMYTAFLKGKPAGKYPQL